MSFERGQGRIFDSVESIRMFGTALRKTGRPVVLVPLGEGLHAGHISMIRAARRLPGAVVVVAYAGPDTDHDRLRAEHVDAIFPYVPATLWPRGLRTTVSVASTGGEALTRVLALLGATAATAVMLGEKDFTLVVGVRLAVRDLLMPVAVHSIPIVRMPDGLAMSLRNAEIDPGDRERATAIAAALTAGAHAAEHGAEVVVETVRGVLAAADVQPDYIELRGLDLGPAPDRGDARLFVGVTLGSVELSDNVGLPLGIGFRNIDA
ncbi:pantoate--beta-alanine ligase [Corynebacterium pacaense]|uniref:pantoate--beta-alanine ligase n=1 Tax=Corynebacterium pacaense TaxID=1816684 RepID=UPI0009BAC165|nr:pantoate--beta-alanine ligase [Corynebacterium pacaense]